VRGDGLERLAARARRTGAAVIALVDRAEGVLSDLSLECSTVGWLRIGSDVVGRKMCVALRSGPRRDAQVLIDVLEPRSAREAIRNERIAAE
jgi:hypothetical protein